MELMKASLDKLYKKVYATPGRRVPEEVLRQIAFAVSLAFCLTFLTVMSTHNFFTLVTSALSVVWRCVVQRIGVVSSDVSVAVLVVCGSHVGQHIGEIRFVTLPLQGSESSAATWLS